MRLKNKAKHVSAIILMLIMVVSSSMVFAADPNTWTTKAPMANARYSHEAVVLNGQIYVFGGQTTKAATLNSVEQYNPVTDTWTTKAPMAYARYYHQVAVIDEKIYAIGGIGSSGSNKALEEYNPATDTWTTKASMNNSRSNFASAVVNGKIYAIGDGASVEEYSPANNIWITKAPMSVARRSFKVAMINGEIFAIGGNDANGAPLKSVEAYDPATDSWIPKAPMNIGRANFQMAVLNGKIYVMAGVNTSSTLVSGSVEEYDPVTDKWTTKASMPTPIAGKAVTLNSKIYMVGAGSGNKIVEEYDPATDKWTYDAPLTTGRSYDLSIAVNGKIYHIGGATTNSVEEYTPTSTGGSDNGGNENPPVITGNSAILEITMVNGVIKEYDLNAAELDSFLTWYDKSSNGSAPAYYTITKKNNIKPFLSRKEYIAYSKIASFEIKEYAG